MPQEECPIKSGLAVYYGFFKSHTVERLISKPVYSDGEWIARVQYTTGAQATVRYKIGPMRYNGLERVKIEEV